MLVQELMSSKPVTVTADTSVPEALRIMRERKVRRLPVLDHHGKMVGIVSDKDLLYASPSPATTLAIWEISDLLAKLKVEKVMTREVVTVSGDTPLEEAARIMTDRRIGGLPVMDGENLVGIITETDLFKALLQQLGGRRSGVRVSVSSSGAKGTLAKITSAIFGAGGDIVGFGLSEIKGSGNEQWQMTFKVQDVPMDKLVEAIRPTVDKILDVRET
jgi:acetoin utilization protein AcuB